MLFAPLFGPVAAAADAAGGPVAHPGGHPLALPDVGVGVAAGPGSGDGCCAATNATGCPGPTTDGCGMVCCVAILTERLPGGGGAPLAASDGLFPVPHPAVRGGVHPPPEAIA